MSAHLCISPTNMHTSVLCLWDILASESLKFPQLSLNLQQTSQSITSPIAQGSLSFSDLIEYPIFTAFRISTNPSSSQNDDPPALASPITFIFVFEAFIGQLYTGPGHQHIVCPSCPSSASYRLNPIDSFLGPRSNDPLHPYHPSLSFILPNLCQTSHKLGEPCNS